MTASKLFSTSNSSVPGAAYAFATLGYATHGLLDAATSYGTQLLGPFSDLPIAWKNQAVVAFFVTVPLGPYPSF